MAVLEAKLAFGITVLVLGTFLADCDGLVCWKGIKGTQLKRVQCSGRSCVKTQTPAGIGYDCWVEYVPESCHNFSGTLACFCNKNLCNIGGLPADDMQSRGISTTSLDIDGKPTDNLLTKVISTDYLNDGGIPTDDHATEGMPNDELDTEDIPSRELFSGNILINILTQGNALTDVLDDEGGVENLKCWSGHGNPSVVECYGSCVIYKFRTDSSFLYHCYHMKLPDGCRKLGRSKMCFCNKNLCNTKVITTDGPNTEDIQSNIMENRDSKTDFLNIGAIQINNQNTRGGDGNINCWSGENNLTEQIPCHWSCAKADNRKGILYGCWHTKQPDGCKKIHHETVCFCNTNLCNTGGIPTDDPKSKGVQTDILNIEGIPTDFQNTGSKQSIYLKNGDNPTYNQNTGVGVDSLMCWTGFNNDTIQVECYRSCAKTKIQGLTLLKGIMYGCLNNKRPNGCQNFAEGTICTCNTNLCNTGDIPTDAPFSAEGTMNTESLLKHDTRGFLTNLANIVGEQTDDLGFKGANKSLYCWYGLNNETVEVDCLGSCAKYKNRKGWRYSCVPFKKPDGCKNYDRQKIPLCFCNTNLCNNADLPTNGSWPAGRETDMLIVRGTLTNNLIIGGTPTEYMKTTRKESDDQINADIILKKTEYMYIINNDFGKENVHGDRNTEFNGMDSLDIKLTNFANTGGEQSEDLEIGGAENGLKCWFGENNRTKQIDCKGSCAKTEIKRGMRYGCLYNKKPDGCRTFGHRLICYCNTNLCNTGGIPPDVPIIEGPERRLKCWYGEKNQMRQIDCNGSCTKINYSSGIWYGCVYYKRPDGCIRFGKRTICSCSTDLCNTGGIPTEDINAGSIQTDYLITGGIPADEPSTGGIQTDILYIGGIPSNFLNAEHMPTNYMNTEIY